MKISEFLTNILRLKGKELIDICEEKAVIEKVKKGDKIFLEGRKMEYVVLLVEGIFRGYFVDSADCEITDCIENKPGAPLMPGFDLSAPALATEEALTDGAVFKIKTADLHEIMARFPAVASFYQKCLENGGQYHLEKSRMVSKSSMEQRYLWFLAAHSGILNRIPDKYIASYLRMSQVTFSKLHKKMSANGAEKGKRYENL